MDIQTFVKRNSWVYTLYFYVVSALIRFYKLFLSADNNLILFVCYGGRRYSDSTKVIYEAMLNDERFKDYKNDLHDWQIPMFETLREYYDTNILATLMAPVIPPEHARNCLWVLKVRED